MGREQLVFYASIYLLCLNKNKTAKMVYYENCCFCFKSKTGAKIIAILGLVFAGLAILANIIGLLVHSGLGWVGTIGGSIAIQIGVFNFVGFFVFYALVTLCQIGYLAIFAMLFHGVKNEKHGFLVPFLVFHMISLVIYTIWTGLAIINGIRILAALRVFAWKILGYWIIELLSLAFGYYVWDVVRSVYRDIKQSAEAPAVVMPMDQYGQKTV